MGEIERPHITWFYFQKGNRSDKAKRKARYLNRLMNDKDDLSELSSVTLWRYFQEHDFLEALKLIAPYMTATRLKKIQEIAESGGASSTQLQANLELLRAFMPVSTGEMETPSFDSSVRKLKAETKELKNRVDNYGDAIEVIANDPFLQLELERKKQSNLVGNEMTDKRTYRSIEDKED